MNKEPLSIADVANYVVAFYMIVDIAVFITGIFLVSQNVNIVIDILGCALMLFAAVLAFGLPYVKVAISVIGK